MIFLRSIERLSGEQEGYTSSPFAIPRLLSLKNLTFTSPVAFLTGENGAGQSTLLEAIALRAKLQTPGALPTEHDPALAANHTLSRSINLHWALKTAYGIFLRACDLHPHPGKACLDFIREKCVPGGFHIIETPECMCPPPRQLEFLALLKQLVANNAQFLIATHSPILLAFPGAQILGFDGPEIAPLTYDEVPQVKFFRSFLADPEAYVRKL